MPIDVKPMPGLEHLPFAEVWFHAIDEQAWREASRAALALGKSGLEVWTTDEAAELDTKSLFALEQDLLTLADAIGSHYFPHGASASRPEKLTGLA